MKKTPSIIVILMFLITGPALSEEPVYSPDANRQRRWGHNPFMEYWNSMFYPGIPNAPAYCGWIVIKINNATHNKTSFHTVDDARSERDINNTQDVISAPDVLLSDSFVDN